MSQPTKPTKMNTNTFINPHQGAPQSAAKPYQPSSSSNSFFARPKSFRLDGTSASRRRLAGASNEAKKPATPKPFLTKSCYTSVFEKKRPFLIKEKIKFKPVKPELRASNLDQFYYFGDASINNLLYKELMRLKKRKDRLLSSAVTKPKPDKRSMTEVRQGGAGTKEIVSLSHKNLFVTPSVDPKRPNRMGFVAQKRNVRSQLNSHIKKGANVRKPFIDPSMFIETKAGGQQSPLSITQIQAPQPRSQSIKGGKNGGAGTPENQIRVISGGGWGDAGSLDFENDVDSRIGFKDSLIGYRLKLAETPERIKERQTLEVIRKSLENRYLEQDSVMVGDTFEDYLHRNGANLYHNESPYTHLAPSPIFGGGGKKSKSVKNGRKKRKNFTKSAKALQFYAARSSANTSMLNRNSMDLNNTRNTLLAPGPNPQPPKLHTDDLDRSCFRLSQPNFRIDSKDLLLLGNLTGKNSRSHAALNGLMNESNKKFFTEFQKRQMDEKGAPGFRSKSQSHLEAKITEAKGRRLKMIKQGNRIKKRDYMSKFLKSIEFKRRIKRKKNLMLKEKKEMMKAREEALSKKKKRLKDQYTDFENMGLIKASRIRGKRLPRSVYRR